jgi:hypothetical protein
LKQTLAKVEQASFPTPWDSAAAEQWTFEFSQVLQPLRYGVFIKQEKLCGFFYIYNLK